MGCACKIHNGLELISNSPDPTRTLTLRNRFVREMSKRFNKLASVIRQSIDTNDCFGLRAGTTRRFLTQQVARPGQFAFTTSQEKIEAFMLWLDSLQQEYILSGGRRGAELLARLGTGGINSRWTDQYIDTAYAQGLRRARVEMRAQGIPYPDYDTMLDDQGLQMLFSQPVHLDNLGILYLRTYSDLQGITTAMDTVISRVLAQGMAEGRNPRVIADALVKIITGKGESLDLVDSLGRFIPAKRRAEILARTEIIRAHHIASIAEYERAGVLGVRVMAEWSTAGDGRVCEICAEMSGIIYSLERIKSLIPAHPQCRCVAVPVIGEPK